jgi:hypothetical protein
VPRRISQGRELSWNSREPTRRSIIRSITHAPDQTVARPQRLHWLDSISPLQRSPLSPRPDFHCLSRAAGPGQPQLRKRPVRGADLSVRKAACRCREANSCRSLTRASGSVPVDGVGPRLGPPGRLFRVMRSVGGVRSTEIIRLRTIPMFCPFYACGRYSDDNSRWVDARNAQMRV